MARIGGHEEHAVQPRLLQGGGIGARIAAGTTGRAGAAALQFATAETDEGQLHLVAIARCRIHILERHRPAAEQPDIGERVEMLGRDQLGLEPAHRQARHGAMPLVRQRPEMAIDIRHQFVQQHGLKRPDVERGQPAGAAGPQVVGHAIGHDDDERPCLSGGDQIVHDQIGMTLVRPGGFVLAPAMLEIEHRITLARIPVVTGRGVDEGPPLAGRAGRGKQDLLDAAMGHVLQRVEIGVMRRDFDPALPTGGAVEVQRPRIVERPAIDGEMIIVKPLIERPFGSAHPRPVRRLRQDRTAAPAQPQADLHHFGVGRDDAETGIALRIDLRIGLSRLVERGGFEILHHRCGRDRRGRLRRQW